MSNVTWERKYEAFKAIHDRIGEVLERVLQRKGTPYGIDKTASGDLGTNVQGGQKVVVYGFTLWSDVGAKLRWGSAGRVFAVCPAGGFIAMNLLGIKEEGDDGVDVYVELLGTGSAEGTVWAEVISV
jgi:hypothetical protein